MSNASSKNGQAIKARFGDESLMSRLAMTRIAVVTPESTLPSSGQILGKVLADVLARLWPNIDFSGADAVTLQGTAISAAHSGEVEESNLHVQWAPPYDVVIAIGCEAPEGRQGSICVGGHGWVATIGKAAACDGDLNPVGPTFAAAMAAAQTFHRIFANELQGINAAPFEEWSADVRELFNASELSVSPLDLGEVHVFGVGAVTHGMAWLMEQWPAELRGDISLVDRDCYGSSNGQRYAFITRENKAASKVEVVKKRLEKAHPQLHVTPYPTDLNSYCEVRGYGRPHERVIVGLDSEEARRQVAFKLPTHAINMWTGGDRTGAARYRQIDGSACLACDYLESKESLQDEVAEFSQHTGLRPDVIRELLDSNRWLDANEAALIATNKGVPVQSLVNQPLRSILPTLCATGRITLPDRHETTDVPFSFASLLAGIAGFMMLLKDIRNGEKSSEGWSQHNFKMPTAKLLMVLHTRTECICCRDVALLMADEASA
jgi:molybdopterin/thiamine biosynthesis adenylyltransferase